MSIKRIILKEYANKGDYLNLQQTYGDITNLLNIELGKYVTETEYERDQFLVEEFYTKDISTYRFYSEDRNNPKHKKHIDPILQDIHNVYEGKSKIKNNQLLKYWKSNRTKLFKKIEENIQEFKEHEFYKDSNLDLPILLSRKDKKLFLDHSLFYLIIQTYSSRFFNGKLKCINIDVKKEI